MIKEDLLHYLWRTKKFDLTQLRSTEEQPIVIQSIGSYNTDAGPDFSNARIRIGNILWAGHVEMHLKSSDWYKHQHENDPAYENVILHVVLDEDKIIYRSNGERISCLEIRKLIPPDIVRSYRRLQHQERWIPCEQQLIGVRHLTKELWLGRLLTERLERKTAAIEQCLKRNNNHWEEAFYQRLASSFGSKVNVEAFEQLARSLPAHILAKHKDKLFDLEALLFGQAGMLTSELKDDYPCRLRQAYDHLKHKYHLSAIPAVSWKFMRMRPANFPTVRIAQLAMLIYQSNHLFSKVLAAQSYQELENMFTLHIANYWRDHYRFDKLSVVRKKSLGKSFIHLLIINTIAPFIFYYGKVKNQERLQEKAISILEEVPPEQNIIIKHWESLGMPTDSAFHTQALLQLKNAYCDPKQCLNCAIGHEVLQQKPITA